jgi:transcriptional regulator with XRE-family HTH domain
LPAIGNVWVIYSEIRIYQEEKFYMQTINERIAFVRDTKAMKQKDFAELIGVPRSSLSEIESGKRSASIDVIVGISTYFKEISVDWLLTGEGDMYRQNSPNQGLDSNNADLHTAKVVQMYEALNDVQQREILSALEEKKQLNNLMEAVHQLQLKVG